MYEGKPYVELYVNKTYESDFNFSLSVLDAHSSFPIRSLSKKFNSSDLAAAVEASPLVSSAVDIVKDPDFNHTWRVYFSEWTPKSVDSSLTLELTADSLKALPKKRTGQDCS